MKPTERALALLCLAYAVLGLNISAVLVYGPLYVRELEPVRGDTLVGLLFALPSLTACLGHTFWGALHDRFPSTRKFVLLSLLSESVFFSALLASRTGGSMVWLATLFSFASVAIFPAAQAWATLVWEESKGRVLGRLHACESVGWGVATLVSAFTSWCMPSSISSIRALFSVCLLASLGLFAWVAARFPKLERTASSKPGTARSIFKDLALLYSRRDVLGLASYLFVLTCANVAFFAYFSIYLCRHLGGSTALLSASMAGATIGGAILYPAYGRFADTRGRRVLLYGATIAYVTYYGLLCLIRSPVIVALLFAVPIYPAIRVATNAWLADMTVEDERAQGMGLLEGVGSLASVAGPMIGCGAVSLFGYGVLPMVPLALLATGLALLVAVDRRRRRLGELASSLFEGLDLPSP